MKTTPSSGRPYELEVNGSGSTSAGTLPRERSNPGHHLAVSSTANRASRNRESPERVLVVGGGDHARVVVELLQASGALLVGFVEPDFAPGSLRASLDELPHLGGMAAVRPDVAECFTVAIGDNAARAMLFTQSLKQGVKPIKAVHPFAMVLAGAAVEPGAQVCAAAVVGVGTRIHENAIVNTAASVDHDGDIGPHSTIGPGARLAGRVSVGEGAHIGIGAVVREGINIGPWAFIAAGAVVVRDVPPRQRVAGVPARPMA